MSITRIVKLSFNEEYIEEFKNQFSDSKQTILSFEGCESLSLFQDVNQPCIFFTYSTWKSEVFLNQYRASDFFKNLWSITKLNFNAKPEAWSIQNIA